MRILFDNNGDDLETKREEVLSKIKEDDVYRQFKRVVIFVTTHTNMDGLIYHTVDGAVDFDQVRG